MLISFEGIDGVGKTTQISLLKHWFSEKGISCERTFEPGDHGMEIDQALMYPNISPLARLFLFLSDRAQHFTEVIEPSLKQGKVIITDRYIDSTLVYQSKVLSLHHLMLLNELATQNSLPDLTILLDMDPERIRLRESVSHANESVQDTSFYQQARHAYLWLAANYPDRIKIINADRDIYQVYQEIVDLVSKKLKEQ